MMPGMVEEGVDALIERFKQHANEVSVASRYEGSPLIECLVGEHVLYLFERTNPYLSPAGAARVIVQPEAARCERLDPADAHASHRLEAVGHSAIVASGTVVQRDDPFLVVDAGVRLVVSFDELPDDVAAGDQVRFESRAPVHGFVLPPRRTQTQVSTDELV